MLEMIKSGMFIYGLAVLAVIGVLTKVVVTIRYSKLERQAGEAAVTRDNYIRLWKNRFENAYRINKGVNDAGLFVERCVEQCKLFGIRLAVWDRINRILCGTCMLLGMMAVTAEQRAEASAGLMLGHFLMTMCICGLMLLVEYFCETGDKRQRIGVNLEEYFTNVLSLRLQNGAETITAESEPNRTDIRETVSDFRENKAGNRREDYDREMSRDSLKESLEKIAASREPEEDSRRERKSRAKREEDARLIEEILREYLR